MTCEDCYHYDACRFYNKNLPEEYEPIELQCDNFKDKLLIVELPCKVGDKVYKVIRSEYFGNYIQEMTIKEFKIFAHTDYMIVGNDWNDILFDKSKAEEKLKKINNEH